MKDQLSQVSSLLDDAIGFAKQAGNEAWLAELYRIRSMQPNQVGDTEESLRFTQLAIDTAEASRLAEDSTTLAFIRLYHADRLIDVGRLEEAEATFAPARRALIDNAPDRGSQQAIVYFTDYKLAFKKREFDRAESALIACQKIYLDIVFPSLE